ncbi:hypothetical protein BJX96DRAFT_153961 [Aspergillus floccosus]
MYRRSPAMQLVATCLIRNRPPQASAIKTFSFLLSSEAYTTRNDACSGAVADRASRCTDWLRWRWSRILLSNRSNVDPWLTCSPKQ